MANDIDKTKNWAAEMRDCEPPSVGLDWTPDNTLTLAVRGDWARILEASGNISVANGLMVQAAMLGSYGKRTDQEATDFVTGFVDAMEPQDAAEALLLTQMAATHQATMMLARRLNHVENIPQQDAAERALNKLARSFAAQMEALRKHRNGGKQTVTVQHVNVSDGGQAIVGNVQAGGGNEK